MKFYNTKLIIILLLISQIQYLISSNGRDFKNKSLDIYNLYLDNLITSKDMILNERFLIFLNNNLISAMKKLEKNQIKISFPSEDRLNNLLETNSSINVSKNSLNIAKDYEELKDKELKEYHIKLLKARLLKSHILKNVTKELKFEMFNDDLYFALRMYSKRDFELSELLFKEIIDSYGYSNISDVLFFRGESLLHESRFTESQSIFREILESYPNSEYYKEALERFILVSFIKKDNVDLMLQKYRDYKEDLKDREPLSSETDYLLALSLYQKISKFVISDRSLESENIKKSIDDAMEELSKVKEINGMVPMSKYLKANLLSILKRYDEAEYIYKLLYKNKYLLSLERDIYDDCLLKRCYIMYNRMEAENREKNEKIVILPSTEENLRKKMEIFTLLSNLNEDSPIFENGIIAKAWIETNFGEYKKSNELIDYLFNVNPKTELYFEANTLKGYNNDALGLRNEINQGFESVLDLHSKFFESQKNRDERIEVIKLIAKNYALSSKILGSEDSETNYKNYFEIKDELMDLLKSSKEYLEQLKKYNPQLSKIAKIDYQKKIIRDIIQKGENEIDNIETLIEKSIGISNKFAKVGNVRDYINSLVCRDNSVKVIKNIERDIIRVKNRANRIEKNDAAIDYWSDLSFVKYMLNSLDLENLNNLEKDIEIKENQLLHLEEDTTNE
ncbi:MAG: hypothetical protein CR982_04595 [Candidatus Cloacimonadota bacterium]|nr:MAG: hypothetical protein CR982_04595 [Candidatus Cloacimonadota bacterium]PIE78927.1 MAG: hypothetical protein CSA15_05290 [Candidatus Delongbacteria bacterium]